MADPPKSPRGNNQKPVTPRAKSKKTIKIYLKANEDFTGKDNTELTFKKGQIIKFKGRDESGFFEGALLGSKTVGFFPSHIVHEVTRDGVQVPNSAFAAAPSAAPRAAVVTASVTAQKESTKELLSKHLETRPEKTDLIDRHIFQPSALSPELFEAQRKLEQAKTKDFLASFLRNKEQNREPLLTESAVDEFVLGMSDPASGVPVGKHSKNLKGVEACFTGKQVLQWLIAHKHCEDKAQAAATMTFLLDSGVIVATNGKKKPFKSQRLYRLRILNEFNMILNMDKIWHSKGRDAVEVSTYLVGSMLELVARFKRTNGSIDFETMSKSVDFKKVSLATAELQKITLAGLSTKDKETFFVNVSNLLTLHTHCKHGVPATMLARKQQFEEVKYLIDGQEYSRHEINTKVFMAEKPTGPVSPRGAHALGLTTEPLWLFGCSDGTASTPFFAAFTQKDYDEKIRQHASEFLQSHSKSDTDKLMITYPFLVQHLSKELKMSDEAIHTFLLPFLGEKEQKMFASVKEFGGYGKVALQFGARSFEPNYLP